MTPSSTHYGRDGNVTARIHATDRRQINEQITKDSKVTATVVDEDDGTETTVAVEHDGYDGKATLRFLIDDDLSEEATAAIADALTDSCLPFVNVEARKSAHCCADD